jgi:hypothetical protein
MSNQTVSVPLPEDHKNSSVDLIASTRRDGTGIHQKNLKKWAKEPEKRMLARAPNYVTERARKRREGNLNNWLH